MLASNPGSGSNLDTDISENVVFILFNSFIFFFFHGSALLTVTNPLPATKCSHMLVSSKRKFIAIHDAAGKINEVEGSCCFLFTWVFIVSYTIDTYIDRHTAMREKQTSPFISMIL